SDRSRLRRLTSDTRKRAGSKRGSIHANRRLTPCMREPSHPRWSHTWRTFRGRPAAGGVGISTAGVARSRPAIRRTRCGLEPHPESDPDLRAAEHELHVIREVRLGARVPEKAADAD